MNFWLSEAMAIYLPIYFVILRCVYVKRWNVMPRVMSYGLFTAYLLMFGALIWTLRPWEFFV